MIIFLKAHTPPTTDRRLRWLLFAPALALGLGTAAVLAVHVQQQRILTNYRTSFEAHAASVAQLVREGAREATAAVELIYSASEAQLATAARLLDRLEDDAVQSAGRDAEGVRVWLGRSAAGFDGAWGPVGESDRGQLVRELQAAAPGTLVEHGAAARHGLLCARLAVRSGVRIACIDAAPLQALRRDTGLGPLLRGVTGQGLRYVVIQDADGVLASSPDAGTLSAWSEDDELAAVRDSDAQRLRFRPAGSAGAPLLEGLGAFPLPDESVAVLRVGVDASPLARTEAELEAQFHWLVGAVAVLVLLAVLGAAILARQERRRMRMEQQLAMREEENRHWQAIGQMAATVAHEVRNPLNTLQMAAQRLGREFTLPDNERPEFDELTAVLRSEAERVERVVTEFLELGRPLRLAPVVVPADSAVAEAVIPLKLRAEQEDKLLQVDSDCDAQIRLDRQRFGQIVANLVGNALDAVPAHGRVTVTARCEHDGLHLAIEDDGAGMDEETLHHVLEPFVTTKASGTGLGLPLARRLVEAHQGTLELSSRPGQGTKVAIVLPPE